MDTQIIVAIISGLFGAFITPFTAKVIIPSIVKKRGGRRPRKSTTASNIYLQAVVGGVVGVLLGYFLIGQILVSPCPPFAQTSVSISSPAAGSSVSQLTTVEGSSCHLSEEDELWLLVVPEGVTAYYPQKSPIVLSDDGSWSASAYVGLDDPADIGRGFVLIAAIADQQGGAAIREYFSQSDADFQGLEPLPQGIRLMSQVRVIRK
jgi:hypothetical protein